MWPSEVKDQALASCGRRCCICQEFCGTNIELHHILPEADGGAATIENCIPLCFKCHAEVGHYNVRHPKGTKYRAGELKKHRDAWFLAMLRAEHLMQNLRVQPPVLPEEIYEGQSLQFRGYLFRQTFPGPPNYEDFRSDELETCWLLILSAPFRFCYDSPESQVDKSIVVPEVRVLHMILSGEQYSINVDKLDGYVFASGRVWPSVNGHHRGDALLDVASLCLE